MTFAVGDLQVKLAEIFTLNRSREVAVVVLHTLIAANRLIEVICQIIRHWVEAAVLKIDQQHIFVVLGPDQNIVLLSIIMAQNNGAFSWDQFIKEVLVSLKQEILVKRIYNLKCVGVLSAVILKKFATHARQSSFNSWTPLFYCDINSQILVVQWSVCRNFRYAIFVKVEVYQAVQNLVEDYRATHLPDRYWSALEERLYAVFVIIKQTLRPKALVGH